MMIKVPLDALWNCVNTFTPIAHRISRPREITGCHLGSFFNHARIQQLIGAELKILAKVMLEVIAQEPAVEAAGVVSDKEQRLGPRPGEQVMIELKHLLGICSVGTHTRFGHLVYTTLVRENLL